MQEANPTEALLFSTDNVASWLWEAVREGWCQTDFRALGPMKMLQFPMDVGLPMLSWAAGGEQAQSAEEEVDYLVGF